MDWTSLSSQTVGLLAAMATVISAVVAATAAFVSTLVSGWNGRRLESQSALRSYRLQRLQPAIDEAEARIRGVYLVRYYSRSPHEALYSNGPEPVGRKIFVTPADELHDAAAEFAKWDHWCWFVFSGQAKGKPTEADQEWLIDRLERTVLVFREAIENFLFGQRFETRLTQSLAVERKSAHEELRQLLFRLSITEDELAIWNQRERAV